MKFNFLNRHKINPKSVSVETSIDNIDYSKNDNDFRLVFNDKSNVDTDCQVTSFGSLRKSDFSETLTIYKNEAPTIKLELKYDYSSDSKKEAIKFQRFVAIGLSGFFYLYDLSKNTFQHYIDFNGYFDEFKISNDHLFVAYNSGVYCFNRLGQIKWHNNSIGLDGIYFTDIKDGKVYGREQVDPPDGWRDFVLDFETGNITT